jgi:hypothetical protein
MQPCCALRGKKIRAGNWTLRGTNQLPRSGHDGVDHRSGQASGEGVLLTGVVAPQQKERANGDLGAVPKTRFPCRSPFAAAEHAQHSLPGKAAQAVAGQDANGTTDTNKWGPYQVTNLTPAAGNGLPGVPPNIVGYFWFELTVQKGSDCTVGATAQVSNVTFST